MKNLTLLFTLLLIVSACSPASVANPSNVPPAPSLTPTLSPSATPSLLELTHGFAADLAASDFTQPSMAEAEYKEGSGGSGRLEIVAAGVDETVLQAYKQQAFAWINTWLGANRLTINDVVLRYVSNGKAGDAFRWQVYFRRVSTNNIIWSAGQDTTYPTGIRIDNTPGPTYGHVTYDASVSAQELPDTRTADVRFTAIGLPTVFAGVPVTIDGKQYYPNYRNPLTREFVENAEVKAAYEAAVENLYYPGVAMSPEIFEQHQVEENQINDILADLRSKPSLIAPGTRPTGRLKGGSEYEDTITLNPWDNSQIPAASISVFADGALRDIIIFEVLNADYTRGYLTQYFSDHSNLNNTKVYIRIKKYATDGAYPLTMYITQKVQNIEYYSINYPYGLKLTQQNRYANFLETIFQTGIIPQEQEDMIIWGGW